jgi:integrase
MVYIFIFKKEGISKMTILTSPSPLDIIPLIPFWRRSGEMKGWGYYFPKGRKYGRIFGRWNKKSVKINKRWDGKPLYSRQDCEDTLDIIAHQIRDGSFDTAMWGKDRTVQIERAWAIYQEQSPCGKDRKEARERIFETFILPYFKGKLLPEIEEHHIKDWWSGVASRASDEHTLIVKAKTTQGSDQDERPGPPQPRLYAPSYLKVIRATLKAFLSFHRVTRVKMLAFPKVSVPRKTPDWLTRDEQEKVLEFVPPQHQAIIRFIRTYGCRPSEACSLKKSDVDWGKELVIFRERKNFKDNPLPLFDEVKGYLRPGKVAHWELVFCTAQGRPYTRQILYGVWMRANRLANEKYGVKIVAFKNGTRHSLACQILNKGGSAADAASLLGNTPGVIERAYGTISIERKKEIVRQVQNEN